MNGDGFDDLLSGAYWYENPGAQGGEWKQHQFRTVGVHNEFVSDCGEWIVDVDHDGLPDLVTTGWISNGVWWYKNPGPKATAAGAMWEGQKITDSFDTEGGAFADINGDGKPDLALAHYNHAGVLWIDFSGPTPKTHHLGTKIQDSHGIGIADINGDGKPDILTPHGWFEQIDADNDQWTWHQDWNLGDAGFPILGYDVNHDGKMDLIYGQGHGYGVYWLEQGGSPGHLTWTRHAIDESFSQSHALALGRHRRRRYPGTDHRQAVSRPLRRRPRLLRSGRPLRLQAPHQGTVRRQPRTPSSPASPSRKTAPPAPEPSSSSETSTTTATSTSPAPASSASTSSKTSRSIT